MTDHGWRALPERSVSDLPRATAREVDQLLSLGSRSQIAGSGSGLLADSAIMATVRARPDPGTLSSLYVGEGMTIAAVAARFGVAPQSVHNWLVAAGVPRRPSPATVRRDISDDEIVRLYVDGGLSAVEVAEQLGCSTSLVYARLARLGVPRRDRGARRRRRLGDSELAHLYGEGGSSLRDLARRYGVSAQAVQRWLVAGGIERRPPGAPRARGVEDPVALYVAGWSAPAIAAQLGCSPSTIYRRLDAAGVARRTVEPSISRFELIDALETGMAAPAIAARAGVSVSCVCRALDREQLVTRTQATRQARRRRHRELYADEPIAANMSVGGNAQH
jgi:transposase